MSGSGESSASDAAEDRAEFAYGIGVALGVVIFIVTITFVSYFCRRRHLRSASVEDPEEPTEPGLDDAALKRFPKLLFSQTKLHKRDAISSCCSICLADYKDSDVLRLLPDCGHLFHLKCVDPWLLLRSSCPVCRISLSAHPSC